MRKNRTRTSAWVMLSIAIILTITSCTAPQAEAPAPAATEAVPEAVEPAPEQAAPEAPAAEPITLRMWVHSNPHYQKMAELSAAEYEKETGVKIALDFLPWEEYGSKAVAAFAGGNEPDILEGVASWLYGQKIAAKLDPLPADLAADVATRFHNPSLVPLEYQGQYYGIPLNVNIDSGPLFVANKAAYDELGITPQWDSWDAYIADLQKLTKSDNGVITRSGVTIAGGDLMIQFLMYFLQAGGTFYGPDNKTVTINNDAGKKALQTMSDFLYTYKVDSTDLSDFSGVATGISAGTFYGPWYTKIMDDDFPDVEWMWAKPALFTPETKPYFPAANVWAWMVSSNSPNKEAAWDYIRWLDKNERRLAWSEETGEIPAVVELWKDPKISESKRFGPWLEFLPYQVPLLYVGPQDEYTAVFEEMVSSVLYQQASIDEALAKAETSLNEMLARVTQ